MLRWIWIALAAPLIVQDALAICINNQASFIRQNMLVSNACDTQALARISNTLTEQCWRRGDQCWNGNVENWTCSDGIWKDCLSRWTDYLIQNCNPSGISSCTTALQQVASTYKSQYNTHCHTDKGGAKGRHCSYTVLFVDYFPNAQNAADNTNVCKICGPEAEQCEGVAENTYQMGMSNCQFFPPAGIPGCEAMQQQLKTAMIAQCGGEQSNVY
ncbi:hypothetical protein EC991_010388 [Linnemannia zychae]|nr:hypothetical protein EC991_010388 [Linnemannia zychae]